MNDCIWWFATNCDGVLCRECTDYISTNCDLGRQMLKAYQRDLSESVDSVRNKWARKRGANNAD